MSELSKPTLHLYEEIMLLALCEEKGTISGSYVGYAVAAAVIAELMLQDRLRIADGRRKYVELTDDSHSDDSLLNECIEKIKTSKRPKVLRTWVNELAHLKDIQHKVARNLAEHGVVSADEEKVLWLFTRRVYPEVNPRPEQELRQRMRAAVLEEQDSSTIDARTVIIIALCQGARLLTQVFSARELRQHRDRIKQLVKGNVLGEAAREAVQAVEAAIMVAVMIPAITVATT